MALYGVACATKHVWSDDWEGLSGFRERTPLSRYFETVGSIQVASFIGVMKYRFFYTFNIIFQIRDNII